MNRQAIRQVVLELEGSPVGARDTELIGQQGNVSGRRADPAVLCEAVVNVRPILEQVDAHQLLVVPKDARARTAADFGPVDPIDGRHEVLADIDRAGIDDLAGGRLAGGN
jgi:hypothetical protein